MVVVVMVCFASVLEVLDAVGCSVVVTVVVAWQTVA